MGDFDTRQLPDAYDVLAPDGSEIRLLGVIKGGSTVHCMLPPGGVSMAVRHRTVEEAWYVVSGEGELWRQQGNRAEVTPLHAGVAVTIPLGTHFQFRCTGKTNLEIVIATAPAWPGDDEAVRVDDHWAG